MTWKDRLKIFLAIFCLFVVLPFSLILLEIYAEKWLQHL